MTPCHACPEAAGPSGWCARHRSILAARLGRYAYTVPVADAVAVAQHPGWRGRKWRLDPRMWEDGLFFHASPKDGTGPGYKTAVEALTELDRLNGIPAASDLDALRARLTEAERKAKLAADVLDAEATENRVMWDALDTIQAITDGRYLPEPSEVPDPNPTIGSAAVVKVAGLRRRLSDMERERDAARKALAEAEADRTDARAALTDARSIAAGRSSPPPPSIDPPATLGASTVATVAALRRSEEKARRLLREMDVALVVAAEDRDACKADLAAALKCVEESVTTYRHTSETADYMRERLLPALDAAGVRYDDPPEALRLWVERQEEVIDRQSSDIARLSAERDALQEKLAETADLCRELDEGVTIVCGERDAYMTERNAARANLDTLRARLDRYRAAVASLAVALVLAVVAAVGGGL